MSAADPVAEFVAAQRAKRTASGIDTRITNPATYSLIEGLLAARRAEAGGRHG